MLKQLNFESKVPLYIQLFDEIVVAINSGVKKPGEKVWTEDELMKQMLVSRATVRQAMSLLVQQNFLVRKRGKGTFIADSKLEQKLIKCYSFTEAMKSIGKVPSTKVTSLEIVEVDELLAIQLGFPQKTKLWKFSRIRCADGISVLYQEEYFLFEFFPDLDQKMDNSSQSLYELFAKEYGIIFDRAAESLNAIYINDKIASLLEVESDSLGMYFERKLYLKSTVIGISNVWARGDKFIYKVYF